MIAGLALLSLLAACGSTVQLNGATPGGVGLGASEGAVALGEDGMVLASEGTSTTTGAGGSTTAVGGTTAGGTTAGATGTAATGTPTTSTGAGGKGARAAGTGVMGPGVTKDEIVVGIALADEASRAGNENLLGASGLAGGDSERYYEIMREEINRAGGIAGRKVQYSKFRYSTADGSQVSQLEQEACEYWTSDNRAFTGELTASENFLNCAESRQLATTGESLTGTDDQIFAKYPHHLQLAAMSLTRQMTIMPRGLKQQGFFDRGYKLGIVTYNDPVFARVVDGVLLPALRAQGKTVDPDHIQRVKKLNSNEELGELTAQIQSAVLKFKSEGVTHVLIIEENALVTLLFTRSAENQNYRPRYGLNSQNGPTALRDNVPAGQYNRAVGVGWLPTLDVPANELPPNRAQERCLAKYAKHGERPANANNAAIMVGICERMEFLKAAIEAGAPDITIDSFIRGAESLQGTFPSYMSMGTMAIGPGRHAGAAYYRHLKYDAGCNCFHYTSKPIRAG